MFTIACPMPACFRRKQGKEKEKKIIMTNLKLKNIPEPPKRFERNFFRKKFRKKKNKNSFFFKQQSKQTKKLQSENLFFYFSIEKNPNKEIKKATVYSFTLK